MRATTKSEQAWRKVGSATGRVRCRINLPACETEVDLRCNSSDHAMRDVRRFVRRHLPSAPSALVGATFTISAEIRARGLGGRYRVIGHWRSGASVDAALHNAAKTRAELPKGTEVGFNRYLVPLNVGNCLGIWKLGIGSAYWDWIGRRYARRIQPPPSTTSPS